MTSFVGHLLNVLYSVGIVQDSLLKSVVPRVPGEEIIVSGMIWENFL